MKKIIPILFLLGVLCGNAQNLLTDGLSVNENINVCDSGDCYDLSASYFIPKDASTTYVVNSIPFDPVIVSVDGGLTEDDRFSDVIDLGFTFCYFGNVSSQIVIGGNGDISFDTALAGQVDEWAFSVNVPDINLPSGGIFGAYHDMDIGNGGTISYGVTGIAPFRAFVINYEVNQFSCNELVSRQQIVLHETSNFIDVYITDKPTCSGWNSGNAVIGIQNVGGSIGYAAPGRNTGDSPWTATNEAWRFSPDGADVPTTFEWQNPDGSQLSTNSTTNVCPTTDITYTAEVSYTYCDGSIVTNTADVNIIIGTSGGGSVNLGADFVTCNGEDFTLTASGAFASPVTYEWLLNGVVVSGETNSTLVTPVLGDYVVNVTYGASDCLATDEIIVSFGDIINPIAVCQDYTAVLDNSGSVTITGADVDGGSTDNCAIDTITVFPDTFTTANIGDNAVTLTVTDVSGNVSTCVANVFVPFACGGLFTDSGGSSSNYENGEDLTWVLSSSAPGTPVTLEFAFVDIESGWDQLDVYDGPDMTAPLLAGNILNPITLTSTHPSGMLFIHFTSDSSVTREGWLAIIECATILGCADTFVDTGGVTNDYSNSENETWVISPNLPGEYVELNFTEFNTEFSWDGMMIYDGPNASFPVISSGGTGFSLLPDGAWTGVLGDATAPSVITSTDPSGALTIVFTSGSNTPFSGWEATVNCINPCADPTSLATSNATESTIDIEWIEEGTATEWEVEIVETGEVPTGVGVSTTSNPFTVTGLLPDTIYDFYVTAICNPGVSVSYQVGPVTDSTICEASVFSGIILEATKPINGNQINLCNGETVDLSLSGGFIPSSETYQWQFDGVDVLGQTNNMYSGITTAGLYTLVVTLGNCIETFDVNVISSEAIIDIVLNDDCTATTTVEDSLGNSVIGGTFSFNPMPTDGVVIDSVTGELQFMSVGMMYNIEYTTVSGCVSTTVLSIPLDFGCIIPSGISPNTDGINDFFEISFLQANKLTVYNRYGNEVYAKNNYRNEWFGNSDGGDELPVGTYYYVIEVPNSSESITGWVYINREN